MTVTGCLILRPMGFLFLSLLTSHSRSSSHASSLSTGKEGVPAPHHLPGASRGPEVIGARSQQSRSGIYWKFDESSRPGWARWVRGRMSRVAGGSATRPGLMALGASQVQQRHAPPGRREDRQRHGSAGRRTQRQWEAGSSPWATLRGIRVIASKTRSVSPPPPRILSPTDLGSFPSAWPSLCPQGHLLLPGLTSLGVQAGQPTGAHTAFLGPWALSVALTPVGGI